MESDWVYCHFRQKKDSLNNFITSLTSPYLSIWVHSDANLASAFYGGDTSFNDLKIEVFSGGTWVQMDSIGVLNTGWNEYLYDLSTYGNIVRFRFRVNNNNFGDFVHDIAIDDFSIFNLPAVEAELLDASISLNSPVGYTIAPLSQSPAYDVQAVVRNAGSMTLTNAKIVGDFGTYKDSATAASVSSLTNSTLSFSNAFMPQGSRPGVFNLTVDQNDTTPANNTLTIGVTDSTFARDDSVESGSLGFTGATGIFGNIFDLTASDVLTSSSFFLLNPPVGDRVRIVLYSSGNQIAGEPDTLGGFLDSTDFITITGGGWITLPFKCQPLLDSGQYFIAVQQPDSNNISCGYDSDTYIPGTSFFGNGTNRWTEIGAVPSLVSSFMVRMNFGPETAPKATITASAPGACLGDTITLSAPAGLTTYAWTGAGVQTPTASSTQITAPVSGTLPYLLMGTDANGCMTQDLINISFDVRPMASVSSDTTICEGQSASLTASGGTTYSWSNGDTSPIITVNPTDTTTYAVNVAIGGCGVDDSVTVNVPEVSVTAMAMDAACNGDSSGSATLAVVAPSGVVYDWSDDPNVTTGSRSNLPAGTYTVTITDSASSCTDFTSFTISEPAAIALAGSAFGSTNGNNDGFAVVDASGGTPPFMYAWSDANMQTGDTATSLAPGAYTVIVTDANGCIDSVSVTIDEYGVGIDDLLNPALVKVYPNPNTGTFVLEGLDAFGTNENLQISVYDLTGKRVFAEEVKGQYEAHISLPADRVAGVYMVHVKSESLRVIKRVLIQP